MEKKWCKDGNSMNARSPTWRLNRYFFRLVCRVPYFMWLHVGVCIYARVNTCDREPYNEWRPQISGTVCSLVIAFLLSLVYLQNVIWGNGSICFPSKTLPPRYGLSWRALLRNLRHAVLMSNSFIAITKRAGVRFQQWLNNQKIWKRKFVKVTKLT